MYASLIKAACCGLAAATTASSALAANLIVNGDFTNGDFTYGHPAGWPQVIYTTPGFSSSYTFNAPVGGLFPSGALAIGSNPRLANSNFLSFSDVTGEGNMLIVNGSPVDDATVWMTTVSGVTVGSTYEFEAWARNVNDPASWGGDTAGWKNSQAQLRFELSTDGGTNWQSLGINTIDLTDAAVDPNQWTQFSATWNNPDNYSGSLTLRLVNQQTATNGNDFALDGLRFGIIPEPSSSLLVLLSTAGLLVWRRR